MKLILHKINLNSNKRIKPKHMKMKYLIILIKNLNNLIIQYNIIKRYNEISKNKNNKSLFNNKTYNK